ncbi:MAG: bcp, partial [Blastococcus sp.]|nr:bcp [Blastococcus sp.]MCW2683655.1 bcp [Blastococcus sp.]
MTETDSGTDPAPVRLSPGDLAPDFTLPDAEGNPVSL